MSIIRIPQPIQKLYNPNSLSYLSKPGKELDRKSLIKAITTIKDSPEKVIGVIGSWSLGKTSNLSLQYGKEAVFVAPFRNLKTSNKDKFLEVYTAKGISDGLTNLHPDTKYIIIDEAKTLINQVFTWGGVKEDTFFKGIRECLQYGIKAILLDANMDEDHLTFWSEILGPHHGSVLINTSQPQIDRGTTVGITTDKVIFDNILWANVNKETVSVLLCDKKKEGAERYAQDAKDINPDWNVLVLAGTDTTGKYDKSLEDYREAIYNHEYDLIIGSPCMFEGVSLDNDEEKGIVFGLNATVIGTNHSMGEPARRACQANCRVRNPDAKRIMYIHRKNADLSDLNRKPTNHFRLDRDKILKTIRLKDFRVQTLNQCLPHIKTIRGHLKLDDPYFNYLAYSEVATKLQKEDLVGWIIHYLRDGGYAIRSMNLATGYKTDEMVEIEENLQAKHKERREEEKAILIQETTRAVKASLSTSIEDSQSSPYKEVKMVAHLKNNMAEEDLLKLVETPSKIDKADTALWHFKKAQNIIRGDYRDRYYIGRKAARDTTTEVNATMATLNLLLGEPDFDWFLYHRVPTDKKILVEDLRATPYYQAIWYNFRMEFTDSWKYKKMTEEEKAEAMANREKYLTKMATNKFKRQVEKCGLQLSKRKYFVKDRVKHYYYTLECMFIPNPNDLLGLDQKEELAKYLNVSGGATADRVDNVCIYLVRKGGMCIRKAQQLVGSVIDYGLVNSEERQAIKDVLSLI